MNLDPSQMDPKLLMELSQLVQQLPPAQLARMQSLMHNAQAGFDVRHEMEEFEKSLPPGFREKIVSAFMGDAGGASTSTSTSTAPPIEVSAPDVSSVANSAETETSSAMDVREARLTLLRAVAEGRLTPDEAERLLFGGG